MVTSDGVLGSYPRGRCVSLIYANWERSYCRLLENICSLFLSEVGVEFIKSRLPRHFRAEVDKLRMIEF